MELVLAANAYIGLATIMNGCAIDPEPGMSQETVLRLAGGTLGTSAWGGVRNEPSFAAVTSHRITVCASAGDVLPGRHASTPPCSR